MSVDIPFLCGGHHRLYPTLPSSTSSSTSLLMSSPSRPPPITNPNLLHLHRNVAMPKRKTIFLLEASALYQLPLIHTKTNRQSVLLFPFVLGQAHSCLKNSFSALPSLILGPSLFTPVSPDLAACPCLNFYSLLTDPSLYSANSSDPAWNNSESSWMNPPSSSPLSSPKSSP
jgi:hypothetical protein